MVHCCHCETNGIKPTFFGDPLWIRAKKGEKLRDIKKRIQAKLEIPDEDFKQWRFGYHRRPRLSLEYLKEDDEVVDKFGASLHPVSKNKLYLGDNVSFIALQHENTKQNPELWQHIR